MTSNSLQQYIDLYNGHRNVFDSGTSMSRMRARALDILTRAGSLPTTHTEGYGHYSVDGAFAPDYGINVNRLRLGSADEDIARTAKFRCGIPNIPALVIYVYNDRLVIPARTLTSMPEGLTITSLSTAGDAITANDHQPGDLSLASGNVPAALNSLLWQDGVKISIAKGTVLAKPLQIVNLLDAQFSMASFRRILIEAGAGSQARILLCDHTENDSVALMAHQVMEVFMHPLAEMEIYDMEESGDNTSRLWQLFADLDREASLKTNLTTLRCGRTRNELHVNLRGEHAAFNASGMALADRNALIDTSSNVCHSASHCQSEQMYKYVVNDSARGSFEGLVTVMPHAVKTSARQTDKNLLLSPEARMHAEPHLLILCDDVKCSHGATTGQLDQKALFYLRSRGIPLKEAESMLVRSFMVDVIDSIDFKPLRDRIHHLVDMRLSGQDPDRCHSCRNSNPAS